MKIKIFFSKIIGFLKRHKYSAFIVLVAFGIAGVFMWDGSNIAVPFDINEFKIEKKKEDTKVRAPLSGIKVEPTDAKKRPIAVVIDNHPGARPQTGLDKASLIYETYAEGGITRMLAVFQENDFSEVGPVRSARVEFVHWANELEAVFVHVGGSEDALSLITKNKILDFNQFYNGSYFWRSNSKSAPHNVFTSSEKVRNGASKLKYTSEEEIESFSFKEDNKIEERPEAFEFSVSFSGPLFKVKYVYNKNENIFKRFISGAAHKDAKSGEQFLAKNVIVQYVSVVDRFGKDTQVEAIGSGKIDYYIDGKKFEGTWSKLSSKDRTKYLDLDGKEIVLNAGTTWIEVERK